MSEITPLGLCTDNLVTIIQPSSTVECMFGEGNGCCGTQPTQASYDISGSIFSSPQTITLPINSAGPCIVTGAVRLVVTAASSNPTLQLAVPTASWYSTVFVPNGTNATVSLPFSLTAITNTITLTVTIESGSITVTSYTVPYTVLTL